MTTAIAPKPIVMSNSSSENYIFSLQKATVWCVTRNIRLLFIS